MNLMGAEKAVLIAVPSSIRGRRGPCDIVGDQVDKGLVRSREGFDSWPRVVFDGEEEVPKGSMGDEPWHGWGRVTCWVGLGIRRE